MIFTMSIQRALPFCHYVRPFLLFPEYQHPPQAIFEQSHFLSHPLHALPRPGDAHPRMHDKFSFSPPASSLPCPLLRPGDVHPRTRTTI